MVNTLIGFGLVAITVVIHGVGTTSWLRVLSERFGDGEGGLAHGKLLQVLVSTVFVLLALHAIEIIVWATMYLLVLPAGVLGSFEEAVYFSFVTFTTLGYGDITLTEGWRLLSGIEAMNGIMLAGWSTAMLFAVVQRAWQGSFKRDAGR